MDFLFADPPFPTTMPPAIPFKAENRSLLSGSQDASRVDPNKGIAPSTWKGTQWSGVPKAID